MPITLYVKSLSGEYIYYIGGFASIAQALHWLVTRRPAWKRRHYVAYHGQTGHTEFCR